MKDNPLGAPPEHIFLFGFKAEHLAQVILLRQTLYRFQAFSANFGVGYLARSYYHSATFDAFAALNNYPLSGL
jgi:hypothetical protein